MELSGPGGRPARSWARTRWFVQSRIRSSLHRRTSGLAPHRIVPAPGPTLGAQAPGQAHQASPLPNRRCGRPRPSRRPTPSAVRPTASRSPPSTRRRPSPTRWASGTRAPSRNTSLKSTSPPMCRSGRTSTPRLAQVDQEVGDALPLGHVGVGPGQQHGVRRQMGPRRPHLLAGDHPLVAVALGPGGQRGQVRAGAGLAEELAPALLVAHDRRQEAQALLLGAVGEESGRGQIEAERVEPARG